MWCPTLYCSFSFLVVLMDPWCLHRLHTCDTNFSTSSLKYVQILLHAPVLIPVICTPLSLVLTIQVVDVAFFSLKQMINIAVFLLSLPDVRNCLLLALFDGDCIYTDSALVRVLRLPCLLYSHGLPD